MSVEQPDVVDFTATDPKTGSVSLIIADHLDWVNDQPRHMWLLQEKINAYFRFIESEEIFENLPAARGKPIIIRVVAKYHPSIDANRFYSEARRVVRKAGFKLEVELEDGLSLQGAMVKVKFELPEGDEFAVESMWAISLPDGTYMVDNSPFSAFGVSAGDIVYAREVDGDLCFTGIAQRGGHSTYRVKLPRDKSHEYFLEYWPKLSKLGCIFEWPDDPRKLYAIDVPPGAPVGDIYNVLSDLEKRVVWEFEEAHFCDTANLRPQ